MGHTAVYGLHSLGNSLIYSMVQCRWTNRTGCALQDWTTYEIIARADVIMGMIKIIKEKAIQLV